MSKRISLSGLLAVLCVSAALFCIPVHAAEQAAPFPDVPDGSWYAASVAYVREHGLMAGTSAVSFSPNLSMTRGMLVTVLYRAAGSPPLEAENLTGPFADVPSGAWYADGVYWARSEGIASGYGDQLFGPDDPITREQLAAVLWRCAGAPDAGESAVFLDEGEISPWASAAVDWARSQGLMDGKDGNRFDPSGSATRAEAAVVLARYHQQFIAAESEPETTPEAPSEPETTPEQPETVPEPEIPPEQSEPMPEPEAPEQEAAVLQPNRYDSSAFVVENGFLTYQGGTPSYVGVDVSSHQDWIDWNRVAAAGVDFAMIRVGYRGYTVGRINQDPYWEHNIAGALAAGLDVGVYFYSQATSEAEAQEEALWVLEQIEGYEITYPVVFDWERVSGPYSRTSSTTGDTVTACAQVFCQMVEDAGYTAMTYGSPSKVGTDLHLSELAEYPFWLAHYTNGWRPSSFRYHYDMWQYTSNGHVDGISTRVDLNICLTDW